LKDSDVLESEKEDKVSVEDGRKSLTVVDVVSHMNGEQESNSLSSKSQVSACTEINLVVDAIKERFDHQFLTNVGVDSNNISLVCCILCFFCYLPISIVIRISLIFYNIFVDVLSVCIMSPSACYCHCI
jgi:hypothetical protein